MFKNNIFFLDSISQTKMYFLFYSAFLPVDINTNITNNHYSNVQIQIFSIGVLVLNSSEFSF